MQIRRLNSVFRIQPPESVKFLIEVLVSGNPTLEESIGSSHPALERKRLKFPAKDLLILDFALQGSLLSACKAFLFLLSNFQKLVPDSILFYLTKNPQKVKPSSTERKG